MALIEGPGADGPTVGAASARDLFHEESSSVSRIGLRVRRWAPPADSSDTIRSGDTSGGTSIEQRPSPSRTRRVARVSSDCREPIVDARGDDLPPSNLKRQHIAPAYPSWPAVRLRESLRGCTALRRRSARGN
jgi:hypothetical protein